MTLPGRPATKKNRSRMVTRTSKAGNKYIAPIPEEKYVIWEKGVVSRVFYECKGKIPVFDVPMKLSAIFYEHPTQRGDLFGYQDALADALQASRLIKNDRLIRATGECSIQRDRDNPRIEFTLVAL